MWKDLKCAPRDIRALSIKLFKSSSSFTNFKVIKLSAKIKLGPFNMCSMFQSATHRSNSTRLDLNDNNCVISDFNFHSFQMAAAVSESGKTSNQ